MAYDQVAYNSGSIASDRQWDFVGSILNADNLRLVRIDNRWGITDISGNIISEPQWDSISALHANIVDSHPIQ